MRFYWRPLIPGERDAELLWGTILGLTGLTAVTWLWIGLPTPLCPFHVITGLPCPTCGLTRGLHCLLRGDPTSAFLFNPLGIIALLGMMLYLVYAVIVVLAKLPRLRIETLTPRVARIIRISITLLIIINWGCLIYHKGFISVLR